MENEEVIITQLGEYEKEEVVLGIDGEVKMNITYRQMNCSKHGNYEVQLFGMFTYDNCPMCGEERQKIYEQEEKEREKKEKEIKMSRPDVLSNMGIGKRYYTCSFDNWIPEEKEPMKTMQEKAKNGVMAVCDKKSGTVLLMGGTGTRKTSLVVSAMRELGEGHLLTMFECAFRLRANDDGKATENLTGFKFLRFLKTTPVLCIDEIGMTSCSDFDKQWIADVINSRDADCLVTFLCSNYPTKDLTPKEYKGIVLDDVFGQTVMSRLEHSLKFRVSGTDFRTLEKA